MRMGMGIVRYREVHFLNERISPKYELCNLDPAVKKCIGVHRTRQGEEKVDTSLPL